MFAGKRCKRGSEAFAPELETVGPRSPTKRTQTRENSKNSDSTPKERSCPRPQLSSTRTTTQNKQAQTISEFDLIISMDHDQERAWHWNHVPGPSFQPEHRCPPPPLPHVDNRTRDTPTPSPSPAPAAEGSSLLLDHLGSSGLNDQACYEIFLESEEFRSGVVGLRSASASASSPASSSSSSSSYDVHVYDAAEALWSEGAGKEHKVAILYYDYVRPLLVEAAGAHPAPPPAGDTAPERDGTSQPHGGLALKRFIDRFSRFDASKINAARYFLSKLSPDQILLDVVMNAHRRDLLPVNGSSCVDLSAGLVVAREREHFFSRSVWLPPGTIPSPAAPSPFRSPFSFPFVDAFMRKIFGGDSELVNWIQKLFGVYLTGEKYSKMVCLSGEGSNGKSVLARWLGRILGSFAQMNCPKALLFDSVSSTSTHGGGSGSSGGRDFSMRQDMMSRAVNDLEGRRLVVCDEVGSDLCLSDDKFKQITGGGDTMTARKLHQDARAVDTSQCKVLTLSNPPFFEVASTEAFRRRLLVIEMPCRFSHRGEEVDNVTVHPALEPSVLDAKLDSHLGEFFRWCVRGAVRFYAEGIADEPAAAVASRGKFFSEKDVVVEFRSSTQETKRRRVAAGAR